MTTLDSKTQLGRPTADSPTQPRKRRRLGKHLVKQGIVPKSAVRSALEEQERTGHRLGEILVARGAIDAATLVDALADQDLVETVSTTDRVAQALPISVAFECRAVVLAGDGQVADRVTRVAVTDLATVPTIWEVLGRPIEPKLTDPDTMERLLAEAYPERGEEGRPDVASAPRPVTDEAAPEPVAEALVKSTDTDRWQRRSRAPPIARTRISMPPSRPTSTPMPAPTSRLRPRRAPSPSGSRPSRPAATAMSWPRRPPRLRLAAACVGCSAAPRQHRRRRRPPGRRLRTSPTQRRSRPTGRRPARTHLRPSPVAQATVIVGLRQVSPATLGRLISLLEQIDYPREKLQVLAVHDPADRVTRRALHDQPMPMWVTETVVSRDATPGPRGLLLCGLRAASGDLVTVLSISEPPEPSLLRAAASEEEALLSGTMVGARSLTDAFLRQAGAAPLDRHRPGGRRVRDADERVSRGGTARRVRVGTCRHLRLIARRARTHPDVRPSGWTSGSAGSATGHVPCADRGKSSLPR